eukprot:7382353-Prymnesium_polylepis.1
MINTYTTRGTRSPGRERPSPRRMLVRCRPIGNGMVVARSRRRDSRSDTSTVCQCVVCGRDPCARR